MESKSVGKILSIAVRTEKNGAMRELSEAIASVDGGVRGDLSVRPRRGITFLAAGQWTIVQREIAVELPWHTRRANVLVDADSVADWIGETIRFGDVRVRVHAETTPCELMDAIHNGLRAALEPDCRAGVYGQVLTGGGFRVGDELCIEANHQP